MTEAERCHWQRENIALSSSFPARREKALLPGVSEYLKAIFAPSLFAWLAIGALLHKLC